MNKYLLPYKFNVLLLAVLLLSNMCLIPAQASSEDIKVYVNGNKLIFDDTPVIENDMVPIPAIHFWPNEQSVHSC